MVLFSKEYIHTRTYWISQITHRTRSTFSVSILFVGGCFCWTLLLDFQKIFLRFDSIFQARDFFVSLKREFPPINLSRKTKIESMEKWKYSALLSGASIDPSILTSSFDNSIRTVLFAFNHEVFIIKLKIRLMDWFIAQRMI